jgi:hypothetical protein
MQIVANLADLKRGQVVQYRGVVSDVVDKDGKVLIETLPALLAVLDQDEVTASAGNFLTLGEVAPDLAARVLELEAENKRLREGLTQAIDALDGKIPDLHERMCCNGHECGCQGSTNLCLLIHDLRTALKGGEI